MLTRGAFATYFGGPELLDQLDERSGSIVRYHFPILPNWDDSIIQCVSRHRAPGTGLL